MTVDQETPTRSATIGIMKQNRNKPLKNLPKGWVLDPLQPADAVVFHRLLKQTLNSFIFTGSVANIYQLKNSKRPEIRYF